MNRSAMSFSLQEHSRPAGTATREILYRVVLGMAALALVACVGLALVAAAGPSEGARLAAPDPSGHSYGSLSEIYGPNDAHLAGLESDCCSHAAEYVSELAAGYAGSTR